MVAGIISQNLLWLLSIEVEIVGETDQSKKVTYLSAIIYLI